MHESADKWRDKESRERGRNWQKEGRSRKFIWENMLRSVESKEEEFRTEEE